MECLIMLSWRGDLVRANDAIVGLFGYSMDNILGQKLSKLLVDFSPDKHLGGTISGGSAAAMNAGDVSFMMRLSLTGKHRDGSTFPVWFDVIRTVQNDEYFYVGRIAYSGAVEKLTPAELEKVMEQVPNLGISSNSIVFSQVELHSQAGPRVTHMSHSDSDAGGDSNCAVTAPRKGPELVVSNAEDSVSTGPDAGPSSAVVDSGGQKQQGIKSMRFSPSVQSRIGLGVGVSKSEKEHGVESSGDSDIKPTRVRAQVRATAEMLEEEPSATSASHLSPPASTPVPSMLGLISGTLTRTVPSIGRQSQRPSVIASEPGGDGSSSEYESVSSARVSRELRMILTWKSARANPLHRSVENRLKLGLLLLLASTISIMVVLMHIRHGSEPMLALTSDMELTALFGEIALNAEIMHFCRVGAGATSSQPSSSWSESICLLNYSGALRSLSSILSDTAKTMYILARSQPALASVAQRDWTLDQFVSPDPMVATKVTLPDFWQLAARISAASNATSYLVGDPSSDRSWQFLVANKPVITEAASVLSDNVISTIASEWWHHVIVMMALVQGR
ncbi:hypothetical protein BCR44DRAFT_242553 [Catenaria anguillulae PL171]|uniref:PAS domain-containing protein n=1 Tax=Catenaria anguillulae PL171 TaxID=765915 RepID=A0A1Y2HWM3_9FUNG|nr:hypothetical protein BCR44DRAFT_242553 [Catenaria anguillulae PL171]